ncbi:MAG: class I SAM-dependent methyltransferase [Bacteroidota bacterium]
MVFADPMPAEAELIAYNAGYFDNAHGGVNTNKLTAAFLSAINLLRVIHVEDYIAKQKKTVKNVLEIGPGGGQFAKHWLTRHSDTGNYTGVESDKICHPNLVATGVKVFTSVDELPVAQQYDLVVISHVLEHTSHPGSFIDHCTKYLSPGGILFIEVPCKDYEHKDLDEPHLLFFDKEPMQRFLTDRAFNDVQLSYHGNTITDLKKTRSLFIRIYSKGRNFLLGNGVRFPFSISESGLEKVADPLERAVIKPFMAHKNQDQPSWWLRAIAIKK